MKKDQKLTLEELKITSFVPSLNQKLVRGGTNHNTEACGGLSISINNVFCCEDNSLEC